MDWWKLVILAFPASWTAAYSKHKQLSEHRIIYRQKSVNKDRILDVLVNKKFVTNLKISHVNMKFLLVGNFRILNPTSGQREDGAIQK